MKINNIFVICNGCGTVLNRLVNPGDEIRDTVALYIQSSCPVCNKEIPQEDQEKFMDIIEENARKLQSNPPANKEIATSIVYPYCTCVDPWPVPCSNLCSHCNKVIQRKFDGLDKAISTAKYYCDCTAFVPSHESTVLKCRFCGRPPRS